jgi:hypothetical protein
MSITDHYDLVTIFVKHLLPSTLALSVKGVAFLDLKVHWRISELEF